MSTNLNRRDVLQAAAVAGVGYWVAGGVSAQESNSPNEKIRFGCIGIGGKGSSDSGDAAKAGDVLAICDVDEKRLKGATNRFPNAKPFTDFRKMLDEMGKSLDAVTVSTPDHTHAPASIMAMKMGLGCFTQKPLTHSIWEARRMGEVAREMKVATQMGNQGTANRALREAAALVQSGALGEVKEAHIWTNRPIWPQSADRTFQEGAQPDFLAWDLWLGPAMPAGTPYYTGCHPFAWRGWWPFGTGALGDMACHTFNMPFMALDLKDPTSVYAETSGHNKISYPKSSKIVFEFPANGKRGPVTVTWYDGGQKPDPGLVDEKKLSGSGAILLGSKATIYSPDDYCGRYNFIGGDKPNVEFEQSPGHFQEFARAIQGGPAAKSNFPDYAGPLTETILLGNLAVWADGKKVEWDAKNLKATNMPELDEVVKPKYHNDYSIG